MFDKCSTSLADPQAANELEHTTITATATAGYAACPPQYAPPIEQVFNTTHLSCQYRRALRLQHIRVRFTMDAGAKTRTHKSWFIDQHLKAYLN